MERRRHFRQPPAVGHAFIYRGKGLPLSDCDIVNVSEGGARIVATSPETLPTHFILFLTLDGSERRSCRVIWRNGDNVGVAFEGLD